MVQSHADPASAPEAIPDTDWSRYPEVTTVTNNVNNPSPPFQPQYTAVPVPITGGDHAPNTSTKKDSWAPTGTEKPTPDAKAPAAVADSRKQIFGIPRRNALLLAAGILFVVVAIAVGVGVGVGVTTHKNASSTSRPQTTTHTGLPTYGSGLSTATSSTSSSAPTVAAVNCANVQNNTLATAMPSTNQTSTSSSPTYRILCAVHWLTNEPALDGSGNVQEVGSDNLVASTFQQCLAFCDEYNSSLNGTVDPKVPGSGCLAVTFNGQTQESVDQYGRNCFLKDRQGVYASAMQTTESAVLVSI